MKLVFGGVFCTLASVIVAWLRELPKSDVAISFVVNNTNKLIVKAEKIVYVFIVSFS